MIFLGVVYSAAGVAAILAAPDSKDPEGSWIMAVGGVCFLAVGFAIIWAGVLP